LVSGKYYEHVLVDIVVEGAQCLRAEERQKSALSEQMKLIAMGHLLYCARGRCYGCIIDGMMVGG
jgi:hypothetical protein